MLITSFLARARTLVRICCVVIVASTHMADARANDAYREDTVKAAFLYRFAGYVDWPPESMAASEFTIAVMGSDQVADELRKLVPRQTIKGLPARVKQVRRARDASDAHILYVGPGQVNELRSIVDSIGGKPILVVTDKANGLDEGSIVNFLMVDRRVRFEISLSAASQAGLKIGADLLSVAARVRGTPLRSDALCIPSDLLEPRGHCAIRVARL